jgi:L-iditol 2-dehydrogenase
MNIMKIDLEKTFYHLQKQGLFSFIYINHLRRSMMLALVKTKSGAGNVELLKVQEPQCKENEVKVEVKYTGICGTDLHIVHGTFKSYPPVILGHEFSGVVTEIGSSIKDVKVGERVAVLGSTAKICEQCSYCKSGNYAFCSDRLGMGYGVNGGFTKYVCVREDMVYKLPDLVSLEEAALSEPLACAVQSIEELTTIHAGDTVLLSGPGPIGLVCLSLLMLKGCKVIVSGTDVDGERLKIAQELGADVIVNVSSENLNEVILRETKGLGVDVTIDCAGAAPSINSCLRSLKKMGKHIQVGIVGKELTLDYDVILYKQIQLFGSLTHSLKTWDRVMNILEQKKINLKSLITHIMKLEDWEAAFKLCEDKQCGKVLLTPAD